VADHVGELEGPHLEAAGLAHHRVDGGDIGGAFAQQRIASP
jgi:hypothetical protein